MCAAFSDTNWANIEQSCAARLSNLAEQDWVKLCSEIDRLSNLCTEEEILRFVDFFFVDSCCSFQTEESTQESGSLKMEHRYEDNNNSLDSNNDNNNNNNNNNRNDNSTFNILLYLVQLQLLQQHLPEKKDRLLLRSICRKAKGNVHLKVFATAIHSRVEWE